MNGIKPASAQFIGIWESGCGVRTEGGTWSLVRVSRESADLEMFGPRVTAELANENGAPGYARDRIVQRWVVAHGVTEYIYHLKEALDIRYGLAPARTQKGAGA